MSSVLLCASKELVDDAKTKCADLVFKEICLEILARARQILDDEDFKKLVEHASERMKEKSFVSIDVAERRQPV